MITCKIGINECGFADRFQIIVFMYRKSQTYAIIKRGIGVLCPNKGRQMFDLIYGCV